MATFSPLILSQPIGPDYAANDSDLVVVKRSLNRLGHFPKTNLRLSASHERPLFDGIRAFQSQRGLRVDGGINPDGETATELGKIFSSPSANPTPIQSATGSNSAPSESECDYLYWEVDIPTCRAIQMKRGKQAAARCFHTATFRYASCLRGTPINQLPPLDTYNQ